MPHRPWIALPLLALLLCGAAETPPVPPESCTSVPPAAWQALLQAYVGRSAQDAVVDTNADDWIDQTEVFRFQPASTRCGAWGKDHVLFVYGGSYNTMTLAEAWLWDGELKRLHGSSMAEELIEEEGAGWLRVVSGRGCCDARWSTVAWLRRGASGAEVALAFPLFAGHWVQGEVAWTGTPGPGGTVRVRYFVDGGPEVNVERSVGGGWTGGALAGALNACAKDRRRELCEVSALNAWGERALEGVRAGSVGGGATSPAPGSP